MRTFRHVGWYGLGPLGVIALVALWYAWADASRVSPAFLPAPAAALDQLIRGLADGELVEQMLATVKRMLQGWFLASLSGIVIGAAIGLSSTLRAYLQPTLEFLRPLPAPSVVPLAIALFGLGPEMVVAVVVFGSVWPALLATVQGFTLVDERLKEVARCLGLSRAAFVWKIGLPNAGPDIVAGMRLSVSIALILSIIGEMLAAQTGLGEAIHLAARAYDGPRLYAGIMLLAFVGLALNIVLLLAERWILAWKFRQR